MANPTLDELCGLVTRASMAKATELATQLEKLLAEFPDAIHGSRFHDVILVAFACANWHFANGVWSNLENTKLRRDLMTQSKNCLILALAQALAASKDSRDTAALAVHIDFDLFQPFVREYLEKAKPLDNTPEGVNANFALQFTLGWIQKQINIRESAMSRIVPAFVLEAGNFNEVEEIALQVNRAAQARKSKSLWSRLFGG